MTTYILFIILSVKVCVFAKFDLHSHSGYFCQMYLIKLTLQIKLLIYAAGFNCKQV